MDFNKKIICFSFLLAGVVFQTSISHAQGEASVGEKKAEVCATCHQKDGNSTNPLYPKIAGQNARYLLKQLMDYKKGPKGGRDNPIMYGMVATLSDKEMEDLAAYFAEQKLTIGKTQAKYIELGQQIYRGGILEKGVPACSGCHGPDGKGNAQARYPVLSGQHPEYTEAQMLAFKEGKRKNGPNGIMSNIAKKLSEDEIKAVSNYVYGLN